MALFKFSHTRVSEIMENQDKFSGERITVKGWIASIREQKQYVFVQLYDGSTHKTIQLFFEEIDLDMKSIRDSMAGECLSATGKIKHTGRSETPFELAVEKYEILGKVTDRDTYLPSHKGVSLETLRHFQYLRPKFQTFRHIYAIRSKLLEAINKFFKVNKFYHLDPNVITSSDCEGAR